MEKVIEVNLGVGMNQLFPEKTKIVIEVDGDQELKNKFPANVEGSEEFFEANKSETKNNEEVVRHVKWDL